MNCVFYGESEGCILRDELCIVVFGPWQKTVLAPLKEATEGELRIGADLYPIPVGPDIQSDQHHTNTHRTIQLTESSMLAQTGTRKLH